MLPVTDFRECIMLTLKKLAGYVGFTEEEVGELRCKGGIYSELGSNAGVCTGSDNGKTP